MKESGLQTRSDEVRTKMKSHQSVHDGTRRYGSQYLISTCMIARAVEQA
jgi:hypothetical protein